MNLLYTPVLAAGPLPRADLLKATSSQEERAHKAPRHYITAAGAKLSMEGRGGQRHTWIYCKCAASAQTGGDGDGHLRDTGVPEGGAMHRRLRAF